MQTFTFIFMIIIVALVIALASVYGKFRKLKDKIVEIEDEAPKRGERPTDNVLALQDRLKDYVVREGGRIKITLIDRRK